MSNIKHISYEEGDALLAVGVQLLYRERRDSLAHDVWRKWAGQIAPSDDAEYAKANGYVEYEWGVEAE